MNISLKLWWLFHLYWGQTCILLFICFSWKLLAFAENVNKQGTTTYTTIYLLYCEGTGYNTHTTSKSLVQILWNYMCLVKPFIKGFKCC